MSRISLLKVNNPQHSVTIKKEKVVASSQKSAKIVAEAAKKEDEFIIPPSPPPCKFLDDEMTIGAVDIQMESPLVDDNNAAGNGIQFATDDDLKLPSEIFGCNFTKEKLSDEPPEPPGEYFFETDHLSLRDNPDYHNLLKSLVILQAQKVQAVRDVESLLKARDMAMRNPLESFLDSIKSGKIKLPQAQRVPNLPNIDWDKYNLASLSHVVRRPETRRKSSSSRRDSTDRLEKVDGLLNCKVEKNSRGQFLVRGRVFDESKPQTFNQPWTPEEQRRLEELLVEYPSEPVEMDRWKKIAACLGNRTHVQIQSRVQKYFLKLQKAGLPVPGKSKRVAAGTGGLARVKRPTIRGKYSNSLIGSRNSTFFPDLKPDVRMTEEDEREADSVLSGGDNNSMIWDWQVTGSFGDVHPAKCQPVDLAQYYIVEEDVSDDEDVDPSLYESEVYKKLKWLKRIRREKELELRDGSSSRAAASLFIHNGYKCDGCGKSPISGGRFTCVDCPDDKEGVNFCCECAPKNLPVDEKPGHNPAGHCLKPARKKLADVPAISDPDYFCQTNNYLDPNYVQH